MTILSDIITSVLAMMVTLGILVTFHEYGHYQVARWFGVRVEKFSIGFGKPILRWHGKPQDGPANEAGEPHRTEYVIGMLPLGGFVKMLGENADVSAQLRPLSFTHKPLIQRAAIVVAGPVANFVLAIALYWFMFVSGVTGLAPVVGRIEADSPAALAGMHADDEILSVDGQATSTWQEVRVRLLDRLGETGALTLTVKAPDTTTVRTAAISLERWLAGEDEPDLLGDLGIIPFNQNLPARLELVLDDGRAAAAGLRPGDLITSADGEPVADWGQWLDIVRSKPEQDIELGIARGQLPLSLTLRPAVRQLEAGGGPELDADGNQQGYIGASVNIPGVPEWMNRNVSYSVFAALPQAAQETWDNSLFVLGSLKKMLVGLISIKNLSGPLTIAQVAGETASYGLEYYLSFLAVLSISLGVLNLLPIPVLDGGHLFYYGIEALIRRPVPQKAQEWGMQVGITLIACIMFLALFNDVNRLF